MTVPSVALPGRRRAAAACAAALLLSVAGCARPRAPAAGDGALSATGARQAWSGRLGLQVEDAPSQSFSGAFDLRGSAAAGRLALLSPLGSTVAVLEWAPGQATLLQGDQRRSFPSLDALAAEATGTPIPVAALFDWLVGTATPIPDWQADLGQLADGRIVARRTAGGPPATLRIVLDR